MLQLKKKMILNQLETVIHHALIRLFHLKLYADAKDLIKLIILADVKSVGVRLEAVAIKARREAKSSDYEMYLSRLGEDTAGNYAVMPIIISLVEQLHELEGGVSNDNLSDTCC